MQMISAWEVALNAKRHATGLAVALFLAAAAFGCAGLVGISNVKWPTVIFTLLAAHAITISYACGQIARLQSALDMKRMALDMRKTDALAVSNYSLRMNEPVEIAARDGTHFRLLTAIDVPTERVKLRVEYLG